MVRKLNQTGLSPLLAVLVIAVAGVVVFGGWYVMKRDYKRVSSTTEQTSQNETPKVEQPSDPSEGGKYLVIKEWGVRFEVPSDVRNDIEYFMNNRAQRLSGGPIILDITSKGFSNGSLKCAEVESSPRSLLSVNRELNNEGVFTKDPQPFKEIIDARYYFVPTACETAINLQGSVQNKKMLNDLKDSINRTLEIAP